MRGRDRAVTLETIEAASPSASEPAFTTPGEAIRFSQSIDLKRRNANITLCIGQLIVSTDSNNESLCLHLENQKSLQFRCEQNLVDVTVEDGVRQSIAVKPPAQAAVAIRLGGREFLWKRGDLIQALQGNAICRIQMGQSGAFLYVANVNILAINVLINCLTGRPFLFWDLTD
jgi:hypothetical protein